MAAKRRSLRLKKGRPTREVIGRVSILGNPGTADVRRTMIQMAHAGNDAFRQIDATLGNPK